MANCSCVCMQLGCIGCLTWHYYDSPQSALLLRRVAFIRAVLIDSTIHPTRSIFRLFCAVCVLQMVDFFCTRFTSTPYSSKTCLIASIPPAIVPSYHMQFIFTWNCSISIPFFVSLSLFCWGHTVIIACNHI